MLVARLKKKKKEIENNRNTRSGVFWLKRTAEFYFTFSLSIIENWKQREIWWSAIKRSSVLVSEIIRWQFNYKIYWNNRYYFSIHLACKFIFVQVLNCYTPERREKVILFSWNLRDHDEIKSTNIQSLIRKFRLKYYCFMFASTLVKKSILRFIFRSNAQFGFSNPLVDLTIFQPFTVCATTTHQLSKIIVTFTRHRNLWFFSSF